MGSRVAIFVVVVALALLWNASEMHYRGCVEAAVATTRVPTIGSPFEENIDHKLHEKSRYEKVRGCSRLP